MEDYEIEIFHHNILTWYNKNRREYPWRYTFDPYRVLISEVLLQQTNVEKVIYPYNNIINKYRNINELANADLNYLICLFKEIGLFYRANRLINISKEFRKRDGGKIPSEWEDLIHVKGIGRYICSAILCFGHKKPYAILDTNVIRIFERIFDIKSECSRPREDRKLWNFAQMLLPEQDYVDYNYALLDFASKECTVANPKCRICVFYESCSWINKN